MEKRRIRIDSDLVSSRNRVSPSREEKYVGRNVGEFNLYRFRAPIYSDLLLEYTSNWVKMTISHLFFLSFSSKDGRKLR